MSEAEDRVTVRLLEILRGNSSDVAAGIRRSATLCSLERDARAAADDCADYLLKYARTRRWLNGHDRDAIARVIKDAAVVSIEPHPAIGFAIWAARTPVAPPIGGSTAGPFEGRQLLAEAADEFCLADVWLVSNQLAHQYESFSRITSVVAPCPNSRGASIAGPLRL